MTKEGARPHGYTESQASYVQGELTDEQASQMVVDTINKTLQEQPLLEHISTRMETVFDGAGLAHYNFYFGFAPKKQPAPPLNPHNLNDAPPPPIGSMPAEDAGMPLGWKESKF